ncbi:unnamed protein product [Discula destructiva]
MAAFPRDELLDLLEFLILDHKADVNRGGGASRYPIFKFLVWRRRDIVWHLDDPLIFNLLVENGAELAAEDAAGRRLIHYCPAGKGEQVESIKDLIMKHEPDIGTIRDKVGRTALHYAAGLDDELTSKLLQPGQFDVNAPDVDGWTPLMWACRTNFGWRRKIHTLLEAGASPWDRGKVFNEEWSPIKIARYCVDHLHPEDLARLEPSPVDNTDGTDQIWDATTQWTPRGWAGAYELCAGCFLVSALLGLKPRLTLIVQWWAQETGPPMLMMRH